ncbi:hypothetical protein ES703_118062 [subsurface metagenome]
MVEMGGFLTTDFTDYADFVLATNLHGLTPPAPGRKASRHTPRVNSKASELTFPGRRAV